MVKKKRKDTELKNNKRKNLNKEIKQWNKRKQPLTRSLKKFDNRLPSHRKDDRRLQRREKSPQILQYREKNEYITTPFIPDRNNLNRQYITPPPNFHLLPQSGLINFIPQPHPNNYFNQPLNFSHDINSGIEGFLSGLNPQFTSLNNIPSNLNQFPNNTFHHPVTIPFPYHDVNTYTDIRIQPEMYVNNLIQDINSSRSSITTSVDMELDEPDLNTNIINKEPKPMDIKASKGTTETKKPHDPNLIINFESDNEELNEKDTQIQSQPVSKKQTKSSKIAQKNCTTNC